MYIDFSHIRHGSTCVYIIDGGLSSSVACAICKPKLCIHIKKSSQKKKKEDSNNCKQYWISKWGGDGGYIT